MRKYLVCVMVLGACSVESADPASTVDNVPRIGTNSLSPTALAATALTTDALDATSAAAMGQTVDERTVLEYAVGCALDSTQSVSFTVDGTAYTYTGELGFATGWTSGALSASDAAWVSACLAARTNLTSTLVTISMRGALPALATTAGELSGYQVEEGAFWGNSFVDLGEPSASSCDGVDQAANDSYGDLPLRQCAQPSSGDPSVSPCGMHYAGLCSAACTTASPYANCSVGGGAAASAVITTFLSGSPE